MTMPTISADCWSFSGTPNLAMMMRKTKRLSTDSEYSVSQPAKYWVAKSAPAKCQTPRPNMTANPT